MNQEKPAKKINFTRRDALKFLGAGAATFTAELSPGADLPQQGEVRHSDVVVVGAGFAGMVAARSLFRAGERAVVLEARDTAGGRIRAGKIAGLSADVGGMWVGPTQTQLLAMIKEYGCIRRLSMRMASPLWTWMGSVQVEKGRSSGWSRRCRRSWTGCSQNWTPSQRKCRWTRLGQLLRRRSLTISP